MQELRHRRSDDFFVSFEKVFTNFFGVSIVDFVQVNNIWDNAFEKVELKDFKSFN